MNTLPTKLTLSPHAEERLKERRKDKNDHYNIQNLMKSGCKWYTENDLINTSPLYIHAKYVCRKAKNKMRYITDGKLEILYDENTNVAITIMQVKDKFLPVTQYVK